MLRQAIRGMIWWWFLILTATGAQAQDADPGEPKHIALIIGNTAYSPEEPTEPPPGRLIRLPNACSDAQTVEAGILAMGWSEDEITTKCDLTTQEMAAEFSNFIRQVQDNPYSIAIIYFAGHGVQIDDRAYIFGVDATPNFQTARRIIANNSEAQLFAGSALDVYATLISPVGVITDGGYTVILDACRSDPVIRNLSGGPRSVSAPLTRTTLLPGILLAVSTQNGRTAADDGRYASALRQNLEAGRHVSTIFTKVANQVYNETRLNPQPQIPTTAGGTVIPCLARCNANSTVGPTVSQPVSRSSAATTRPRFILAAMKTTRVPPTSLQPLKQMGYTQRPSEQLFSAQDVSPKQTTDGVRIDVFWCDGGANAGWRESVARRYAESLADYAQGLNNKILSVRLRVMSPTANNLPTYRFLRDSVVIDPGAPDEILVAKRADSLNITRLERLFSRTTPNYVSLFFCRSDDRTQPGLVYWQAPGRREHDLAKTLMASFATEAQLFRTVDEVEIIDATKSPDATEVRYFNVDDRDIAFRIADSLQTLLKHEVRAKLMTNKAPLGQVEVWIGTTEVNRPASEAIEPGSILLPSRNSIEWNR